MSRPVLSSATRQVSGHRALPPVVSIRHSHRPFSTRPGHTISASIDSCFQPVTNTLNTSRKTQTLRNRLPRLSTSPFAVSRQRYPFSSSSARPSAKVIQNERTGDDGNALLVGISSRAAEVGFLSLSDLRVYSAHTTWLWLAVWTGTRATKVARWIDRGTVFVHLKTLQGLVCHIRP